MTLEQRLKRALSIGVAMVTFTKDGNARRAQITITPRGVVWALIVPDGADMYTSAARVRGDKLEYGKGNVIVWAARNSSFMEQFAAPSAAVIDLTA